jgi:gluconate 2-dehydrogenase gamma chain
MSSDKAHWRTIGSPLTDDVGGPLFFTDREWRTVEAAAARIIPTDGDPGATEAGVVRFIDRYLSGTGYVYAAADGSGFLELAGKDAEAWRARMSDMQRTYRAGLRTLDAIAVERTGSPFAELGADDQDAVLEQLSGRPKPGPVVLGQSESAGAFQMSAFDEGLGFFDAIVAHTRQGFYSDPVYGGNRDRVGWTTIGFPGPASLADTQDGTYSLRDAFVPDYSWHELVPHLAVVNKIAGEAPAAATQIHRTGTP